MAAKSPKGQSEVQTDSIIPAIKEEEFAEGTTCPQEILSTQEITWFIEPSDVSDVKMVLWAFLASSFG